MKSFSNCPNITKLAICWAVDDTAIKKPTEWLVNKFPKLEYIRFHDGDYAESWEVLELNPNVKTFSTTPRFLSKNKWIFECEIQLDMLEIWTDFSRMNVGECCKFLHTLHQQGFYKRLHFTARNFAYAYANDQIQTIHTLPAMEALYMDGKMRILPLPSHWMNSIKELGTNFFFSFNDTLNLAKNMMNVERIFISGASFTDILEFVRHSANLKEIRVDGLANRSQHCNNVIIDLSSWNSAREQLVGACKQIIYVPKLIYLTTKWTGKPTKCSLIQLKSVEACKWEPKWNGIYLGCYNPDSE